jgi:hypothetical protein
MWAALRALCVWDRLWSPLHPSVTRLACFLWCSLTALAETGLLHREGFFCHYGCLAAVLPMMRTLLWWPNSPPEKAKYGRMMRGGVAVSLPVAQFPAAFGCRRPRYNRDASDTGFNMCADTNYMSSIGAGLAVGPRFLDLSVCDSATCTLGDDLASRRSAAGPVGSARR